MSMLECLSEHLADLHDLTFGSPLQAADETSQTVALPIQNSIRFRTFPIILSLVVRRAGIQKGTMFGGINIPQVCTRVLKSLEQ
jgi:hypothetical protein